MFKQIKRSLTNATRGLVTSYREEHNLRFHILAAIASLVLAWFLKLSEFEWLSLLLIIALVPACMGPAVQRLKRWGDSGSGLS